MLPETDDGAVAADAYIDELLSAHGRVPVAVPASTDDGPLAARDAIALLERGLPRFHPSFLFEEWLAAQLRRAAARATAEVSNTRIGELIPIGVELRPPFGPARLGDRRLWVGGAVASGVSIGVAVLAWRRRPRLMRGHARGQA